MIGGEVTFWNRNAKENMFSVMPGLTDFDAEGFRVCALDFIAREMQDSIGNDVPVPAHVAWVVQFLAETMEAIESELSRGRAK